MRIKHLLLSIFILAFIPAVLASSPIVKHIGIVKTNIDVSSSTVVGEVTIHPDEAGKVMVRFDGKCVSRPGDAIGLAASNTISYSANDRNVVVESVDGDFNGNTFSHTRVYDVVAGTNTFYAIAYNAVESDGDGIVSIYGSLTAEFVPQSAVSEKKVLSKSYKIYPIPANDILNVEGLSPNSKLNVYDISGKELRQIEASHSSLSIYISDFQKGVYFLKIKSWGNAEIFKFIKE